MHVSELLLLYLLYERIETQGNDRREQIVTILERARELAKPYKGKLWGQPCDVTPELIHEAVGDGRQILCVEPLSTRPHYYVLLVDSSWTNANVGEHAEELLTTIEDQCGNYEDEEYQTHEPDWPVLDTSCGWSWAVQSHCLTAEGNET